MGSRREGVARERERVSIHVWRSLSPQVPKSDNPSALTIRVASHAAGVPALPRTVLGRNINRLRMERGLTQDDLAERAEIDRRYVQRIEAGTANPGIDVICRLREALNASWAELLRGVGKAGGA